MIPLWFSSIPTAYVWGLGLHKGERKRKWNLLYIGCRDLGFRVWGCFITAGWASFKFWEGLVKLDARFCSLGAEGISILERVQGCRFQGFSLKSTLQQRVHVLSMWCLTFLCDVKTPSCRNFSRLGWGRPPRTPTPNRPKWALIPKPLLEPKNPDIGIEKKTYQKPLELRMLANFTPRLATVCHMFERHHVTTHASEPVNLYSRLGGVCKY